VEAGASPRRQLAERGGEDGEGRRGGEWVGEVGDVVRAVAAECLMAEISVKACTARHAEFNHLDSHGCSGMTAVVDVAITSCARGRHNMPPPPAS